MEVELNFNKNQLTLNAGEVETRIKKRLTRLNFLSYKFAVVSVTIMSKWLIVLLDFPEFKEKQYPNEAPLIFDAIAGEIVRELKDHAVRYRHFTVLEEGPSLIFK